MKDTTRTTWSARVHAWRESGLTAAEFAADKPYKGSTLLWRSCQLGRNSDAGAQRQAPKARGAAKGTKKIVLAEVVRRAPEKVHGRVLVEVAGARISVDRGFDAALLTEVVRALRGAP